MSQISISHLSFSYPTSPVDVLKDASLTISRGWSGVVGPNGGGKTTLLRILSGELQVDPASVCRAPSELTVRYCPQRVGKFTPVINHFAASGERDALRLIGQLGLVAADLERWPSLSPGERKRWQIGAALADLPDLLLLDEPTNHLDEDAQALLLERLDRYHGIGVLVSHDRELLDALTTTTIKINPAGSVQSYTGSYSVAREQWLLEERHLLEKRGKLQAERRKLKRRLDTARQSRDKAESQTSTAMRMKGVRDSDARSTAAKGRVASAERKLGREVELLRHKLGAAEDKVQGVRVENEVGRSVFVLEDPAPMRNLISFSKVSLSRGDRLLVHDVNVVIRRDSRIRLRGPNGSGKTTLIEEMLGTSRLPEERVLCLPQELSSDRIEANSQEMDRLSGEEKGRLLQIVAALGVPPERLLASERPSPGEARKLALAMGLSRQAWLLMLDEPTNHLDLPSIERLEDALSRYSCALVMVSHDERFAGALTSETWTIEQQELVKT